MSLREVNGQIVDSEVKVTAHFYEHAKKVGVKKYEPVDYISVKAVGARDYMSRPFTNYAVDLPMITP